MLNLSQICSILCTYFHLFSHKLYLLGMVLFSLTVEELDVKFSYEQRKYFATIIRKTNHYVWFWLLLESV